MLSSIYDPLGLASPVHPGSASYRPGSVQEQVRLGRKDRLKLRRTVGAMDGRTGGDGGGQDPEMHPVPEPCEATVASFFRCL